MRRWIAALLSLPLLAPGPASAAAYPEPPAGPWAYDQYGNTSFQVGSFRVKAGTPAKPPRIARFRLGVDAAEGRCPALGTRVVVTGKVPLGQAPALTTSSTRYVWGVRGDKRVQVTVGSKAPVDGILSLHLLQSYEGGKWRWVVWDTVLRFGACKLTPISGRPRP